MSIEHTRTLLTVLENIEGLPSPEDIEVQAQYTAVKKYLRRNVSTIQQCKGILQHIDNIETWEGAMAINLSIADSLAEKIDGIAYSVELWGETPVYNQDQLHYHVSSVALDLNNSLDEDDIGNMVKYPDNWLPNLTDALAKQIGAGSIDDLHVATTQHTYISVTGDKFNNYHKESMSKLDELWRMLILLKDPDLNFAVAKRIHLLVGSSK